jgi:hypothetical protein
MPNRVVRFLLACSALLVSTAAQAQSSAAPPTRGPSAPASPKDVSSTLVDPLTVRAAPGPLTAGREARDFVTSFTALSPAIDQIARWRTPICVTVAGLSSDQAARVALRIQEVAEGVGMHALPSGYRANIEVVFTGQPQAFMDNVAKTREEVLGYYHRREKARLKTVTRPVQAWYVTATASDAVGNAGLAFATITATVPYSPGNGPLGGGTGVNVHFQPKVDVVDDPDNPVPTGCSYAPQFTHCMQSELSNVLIVVDTARVKGTLGPLTDYLSLLALAQVRSLDGCSALPSVLDRLGKACGGRQAPDGLTPADAAYLTSLYAADLQQNKPLEEDDIAERMASILTRRSGR